MTTVPSRAEALRLAALHVAARGGSLNLKATPGYSSPFGYLPATVSLGAVESALLVGGVSATLVEKLLAVVGAEGRLVVVDPVPAVLEQLRTIEAVSGASNIRLAPGDLDDYRLDPDVLAQVLVEIAPSSLADYRRVTARLDGQRTTSPLVPAESVALAVLDGTVNRLPPDRLAEALRETHRVLKRGGRIVLTVVLADEAHSGPPPEVSPWPLVGAPLTSVPLERQVLAAMEAGGFYGVSVAWRADLPLQLAEGIELRGYVIQGFKGKEGPCVDQGHAVMYRGPWRTVTDDDGHTYTRGERAAVCAKTFALLNRAPYDGEFVPLQPYRLIPEEQAPPFDCDTPTTRAPRVTKGLETVLDTRATKSEGCC